MADHVVQPTEMSLVEKLEFERQSQKSRRSSQDTRNISIRLKTI